MMSLQILLEVIFIGAYVMKKSLFIHFGAIFNAILLNAIFAFLFSSCGSNSVGSISLEELKKNLDNDSYVIIDTRADEFYNGFKEMDGKRGGHIKGAIQFSPAWLDYIEDDKFENYASGKGILKNKTLIVYGSSNDDVNKVSIEFATRGYKVLTFSQLSDYFASDAPCESFSNYSISVSPRWINELLEGRTPESYQNNNFMIFEVSWGPRENSDAYVQHIKGAYHFNTDWIEVGPLWNLREPSEIEENLLKAGITKDKTIILYSATNQLASYRVYWALKWAGVEDVRVMDGNLNTWVDGGFPTETQVNEIEVESSFGCIIPAHPEINVSTAEDAQREQQNGLKLISNRAWPEHIGEISGYDYIPGKGEPEGAIYGFAGTDSSNMADYYDPDGTLRNPLEIFALWKSVGINNGERLAFYCGTGWRAGVSYFMTQMANWQNTYVYDGGWNAWQMDSKFPVQKGAPNGMTKPDAKNTYGTPGVKKAASCKS